MAQRKKGLIPCVFTFTVGQETPAAKQGQGFLQTEKEKERILARMGVEYVFCPDFSQFRHLTPEEFVDQLLVKKFQAKMIFCGDNFHFGKGASGNVERLTQLCQVRVITVTPVPVVLDEGEPISSTRIRRCIAQGDFLAANRMLGHPYTLTGPVIHGKGLGSTRLYPTANQRFAPGQLVPRNGVYATVVEVDGRRYVGATNVGRKPTVGSEEVLAETHILDFDGNIYGLDIQVEFYHYLRGEQKFGSLEELFKAIRSNIDDARALCQKYL